MNFCDGSDLFFAERMKHHDLIDAINEFRSKVALDLAHDREFDDAIIRAGHRLNFL